MDSDPKSRVVLWFLDLYNLIDYNARMDGELNKGLADKFRSYSRGLAAMIGESLHEALLFVLSKATLKCIENVVEDIGIADVTSIEPSDFIDGILKKRIAECGADKLVYTTLFLASLTVYSMVEKREISPEHLQGSIRELLGVAARIDSPYQEILEDMYAGVKRAAEAALQDSY